MTDLFITVNKSDTKSLKVEYYKTIKFSVLSSKLKISCHIFLFFITKAIFSPTYCDEN